MVASNFRGKQRLTTFISTAFVLLMIGVMIWCAMAFFQTDDMREMTINPARLTGLDSTTAGRGHMLGTLTTGGPADITIIDPDHNWTIDVNDFASASRNCPFHGMPVSARPITTILAGRTTHTCTAAR